MTILFQNNTDIFVGEHPLALAANAPKIFDEYAISRDSDTSITPSMENLIRDPTFQKNVRSTLGSVPYANLKVSGADGTVLVQNRCDPRSKFHKVSYQNKSIGFVRDICYKTRLAYNRFINTPSYSSAPSGRPVFHQPPQQVADLSRKLLESEQSLIVVQTQHAQEISELRDQLASAQENLHQVRTTMSLLQTPTNQDTTIDLIQQALQTTKDELTQAQSVHKTQEELIVSLNAKITTLTIALEQANKNNPKEESPAEYQSTIASLQDQLKTTQEQLLQTKNEALEAREDLHKETKRLKDLLRNIASLVRGVPIEKQGPSVATELAEINLDANVQELEQATQSTVYDQLPQEVKGTIKHLLQHNHKLKADNVSMQEKINEMECLNKRRANQMECLKESIAIDEQAQEQLLQTNNEAYTLGQHQATQIGKLRQKLRRLQEEVVNNKKKAQLDILEKNNRLQKMLQKSQKYEQTLEQKERVSESNSMAVKELKKEVEQLEIRQKSLQTSYNSLLRKQQNMNCSLDASHEEAEYYSTQYLNLRDKHTALQKYCESLEDTTSELQGALDKSFL